MGNVTRSALFEYNYMDDKKNELKAKREIGKDYIDDVKYGVYDDKGELICKTVLRRDAKQTIEEFKEIDKEETGKEKNYTIKKLKG